MQVDPKEAARRLRAWNEYGEGADSGTPNEPGYTHDSLDFQRDLRALLSERDAATARAEAAERALEQQRHTYHAANIAAEAQRDVAIAERDRLRLALTFYADTSKYPAPLTGGMGALWADCGAIARAALTSAKEPSA